MNEKKNQGLYETPDAKIWDVRIKQVLCTSQTEGSETPGLENDGNVYGF